jgi:hypothetical protein
MAEELLFGPEREPRLPELGRPLAVVAAVVVLLAGLGGGGLLLHQPSPPPEGALPSLDRVDIMLCVKRDLSCEPAPLDQVSAMIAAIPELTSTRLVTEEEVRQRDRDASIFDPAFTDLRQTAISPEIEARLRSPGDFAAVERKLSGRPGISLVSQTGDNFWKGKADLAVLLCGPGPHFASCPASAATDDQRAAVVARLREQDGVEKVFLQDKEFGLRLARSYNPGESRGAEEMMEILFVRVRDRAKARLAGRAVLRMPGVGWAYLIT